MANVKKLSVATVFGKIKLSELIEKKTMQIMRVMGTAVAHREGLSQHGTYTELRGAFQATNLVTGEVSRAAILFLPDVALIPILTALAAPGANGVEFAIDIGVTYVAEKEGYKVGGSPYEYSFEHVLEMGNDDPVARVAAKIAAQELARLPAPTPEPEPAPAASPEPAPAPKKGK